MLFYLFLLSDCINLLDLYYNSSNVTIIEALMLIILTTRPV